MTIFRIYLSVALVGVTGYSLAVGNHHGWNYFSAFFSSVAEVTWSGQFNLDFMFFLGLSGVWVAWRHQFSARGIALGVLAFFGGTMFLAPYLLWASTRAAGDAKVLMIGQDHAGRP